MVTRLEPRGGTSPNAPTPSVAGSGGAASALARAEPTPLRPAQPGEDPRIARLFEMTSDLLATISLDGRFTLLNPAWEAVLGWTLEELEENPIDELIHPDDVEQTLTLLLAGNHRPAHLENFTNRYRHRDGSWRWLLWSARCDGDEWYAAAKDVTDRMWLERQALRDPLTHLPNRLLLMDRTRQALARLHRTPGVVALLFVDLDRFKAVNDNFGHDVGDRLLIAVSERLAEMMRDSDTVARLGGDEFVILGEEMNSDEEALALAERVVQTLQQPFHVGPVEVSMPASVGVSITHDPDADPESMLREADVAMYRAKGAGGQRPEMFDESLRREMTAHLEIEERLLQALPHDELVLTYQPIMPLGGGRAIGCEALVRWHPDGGDESKIDELLPATFLPRAEQSELIVQIGDWVLHTACAQAAAWRRKGISMPISINVSARELSELDLAARVRKELANFQLPGRALCLEVTEEAVLRDPERARAMLAEVRRLGVTVALDSFGGREAQITLPRNMPLDMLKLDRSLIQSFERDRETRAMVAAMVALAHKSGLTAVAVGIETNRQLALARELDCRMGQGYLLHRPDSPERLRLTGDAGTVTSAPWRPRVRLGESSRRR
ncbi:MAG TPA: EAL domain-containing protein [Solirubrobacteraceae bacterium]|nr:EAL domain-containing protein [Solirubrobacteraceae bacterium]